MFIKCLITHLTDFTMLLQAGLYTYSLYHLQKPLLNGTHFILMPRKRVYMVFFHLGKNELSCSNITHQISLPLVPRIALSKDLPVPGGWPWSQWGTLLSLPISGYNMMATSLARVMGVHCGRVHANFSCYFVQLWPWNWSAIMGKPSRDDTLDRNSALNLLLLFRTIISRFKTIIS